MAHAAEAAPLADGARVSWKEPAQAIVIQHGGGLRSELTKAELVTRLNQAALDSDLPVMVLLEAAIVNWLCEHARR